MKFKNIITGSIINSNSKFVIEEMKKSPTFVEIKEEPKKIEISKKEKVEDKKTK